ncbi:MULTISPECIES: hypothetical protein [Burkholderia]|uniref:Uncharacterized protein n=1 Tax=Burkholderia pyrrocinia TaxID=60550 RepID=A0A318IV48_BURPY|nr:MULTISPECIES: hypothetical protein [Burkholderia]PXX33551.1 hypothetical protein NA66_101075 [Burkholderia pyrrocinia]SFW73027.1 hypothetical protein SAMN03159384_04300 [Burkholderia sp. NFACC33-1]SFY36952.1 hypothetical protein SAMN03159408_04513 [Burkholderia sp. NFPP32]
MSCAVARARRRIGAIVERRDDRAIVIVRHAAHALLEPATLDRHRALASRHEDELEVLLQPCGGAHDGVRPLLGRLRDAGVTVALDAATLAHEASLLEFASWITRCAAPGDTAEPRADAAVPSGMLFCGLVVRWLDQRNGGRRPERDGLPERTPRGIAADAAEHIATGDPDGQVLGALLDADDTSTGAALDTLSDAVRARRICLATRACWPLGRRL